MGLSPFSIVYQQFIAPCTSTNAYEIPQNPLVGLGGVMLSKFRTCKKLGFNFSLYRWLTIDILLPSSCTSIY